MAKLIGTDPNQVPTNADLGSAAYADTQNMPETRLTNQPLSAKFGAEGDVPTDLASTLDFMQVGGSTFVQTGTDAQTFIKSNHYWNGGAHSFVNTSRGSTTIRLNENNAGQIWLETAPSGSVATTARMKIDENGRVTMPYQPTFTAYINTRTNWTTTGLQRLPFDGTLINQGSHFNTSTNRFTAPTSGRYQFNLSLNVQGNIIVYIYKNGSAYHAGEYRSNPSGTWEHCVIETIITLSANDYVEAYVNLTGTGNAWNGGSNLWDHFSGHLIN